jgi:hypothetical protein
MVYPSLRRNKMTNKEEQLNAWSCEFGKKNEYSKYLTESERKRRKYLEECCKKAANAIDKHKLELIIKDLKVIKRHAKGIDCDVIFTDNIGGASLYHIPVSKYAWYHVSDRNKHDSDGNRLVYSWAQADISNGIDMGDGCCTSDGRPASVDLFRWDARLIEEPFPHIKLHATETTSGEIAEEVKGYKERIIAKATRYWNYSGMYLESWALHGMAKERAQIEYEKKLKQQSDNLESSRLESLKGAKL